MDITTTTDILISCDDRAKHAKTESLCHHDPITTRHYVTYYDHATLYDVLPILHEIHFLLILVLRDLLRSSL